MNYETQNTLRHDSNASGPETATIDKAIERVLSLDAETKRRKRGAQGQAEISANHNTANAFLRHSFLPKIPVRDFNQAIEIDNIERDFYESLSILAEHYCIDELMETKLYDYPYNIALALWDVKEKLKQTDRHCDLKLIQDEGRTYLINEERFQTGYDLYYIPVMPICKMLKSSKTRKTAQLLVSVCSYLYHVADIPYYRQENSFLHWQYEAISDMLEEEMEMLELESMDDCFASELEKAKWVGEYMEKIFYNKNNLDRFEQRVNTFKPRNNFEIEILQLATQALSLYKDYPQTSIFRHAPVHEDCECPEEETLQLGKCISFIASDRGPLYERISEYLDAEFGEYSQADEPTITKRFDGSLISDDDFDFEKRIFDLLDILYFILRKFQSKKYEQDN